MQTVNYPPEVQALIAELAADDDIRAAAKPPAIETTQNHYGHYMTVLVTLATQGPTGKQALDIRFWADVLIAAGGDARGIASAVEVST